jgi:hypothetical protein
VKDLTTRDSWEGPRDKEDRAFYKIAQRTLWLGPQADLLVTKTLFLERDADTKIQTIESNSKDGPIPVAPPPKVFTRFIDCCYPGVCFARKLVLRASIQHAARLISTYPCKEIWGAKGFLDSKEARLACANLYFHSALGGLAIFTCLVGYRMVCLSLLHPTNGEVSFVSTIPFLIPTFQPGASRTFSRSGLAGSVFTNVPAAARPESEKK